MAMFFSKVGDGIPEVTVPMGSLVEGLKILAPSATSKLQTPHEARKMEEW